MALYAPHPKLPPVDARLVEPDMGYEIIEGRRYDVPPCHEPHGSAQSKLASLLEAHRASDFSVALEMLTRTGHDSDFAPDASVYPAARDPVTGGRQLEHLAFEIASTQSLSHAARKARLLAERGVRRVFAIDLKQRRVLEWSAETRAWQPLEPSGAIADVTLAVPLSIAALLDAAVADDAVVRAFRLKRHPEFEAEHEEGRRAGREEGRRVGREEGRRVGREEGFQAGREQGFQSGREQGFQSGREQGREAGHREASAAALLLVLEARGLTPSAEDRERIHAELDSGRLARWLAAAVTCADIASLLAD